MRNNFFRRVFLIIVLILPIAMLSPASADSHQKRGGTLIFGRGGDSVGLDPALEEDGESFKVCDNIYDTLVDYKDGSTELEPSLADTLGEFRRRFGLDLSPSARRNLP